jgi:hypothetical protein
MKSGPPFKPKRTTFVDCQVMVWIRGRFFRGKSPPVLPDRAGQTRRAGFGTGDFFMEGE